MKSLSRWSRIGIALGMLVATSPVWADIQLGIIAPRGAAETLERWKDLAGYLGKEIGEPVNIEPLGAADIIGAAKDGKIDFVLTHSVHTVQLLESVDGQVLATLDAGAGPRFGGVIVAKAGSGISTLADLKGKKVMSMKFKEAAGAYTFQTYELVKAGIDPHKDFAAFSEGKKQDDLVMAVKSGSIDAAFVRTGMLEEMEKEGKIKLADFTIVNARKEQGFPYALSTALYPEWCVTVLAHVAPAQAKAMSAAVMKVTPELAAARKAQIDHFVAPIALDSIKEVMKALKISPYDK